MDARSSAGQRETGQDEKQMKFCCKKCQREIGEQNGRELVIAGVAIIVRVLMRCECGAKNRWRPTDKNVLDIREKPVQTIASAVV